jgi:hypothetical protein
MILPSTALACATSIIAGAASMPASSAPTGPGARYEPEDRLVTAVEPATAWIPRADSGASVV